VRGRDVDEIGLQRALYCSSIGEIEYVLGPIVKGKRIVVEGHIAGTGRSALERLGAEVEELRTTALRVVVSFFVLRDLPAEVRCLGSLLFAAHRALVMAACASFAVYLSGRPLRTHRTFQVPSFLI
jgi:hypothetical protein